MASTKTSMWIESIRFAVVLALVGAFGLGCGPAGLSRERAIDLALASAPGDPEVVSADAGVLGQFVNERTLPDEPRDRRVWAVVLDGAFEGECVVGASGESVCPDAAPRVLIVLDFATGRFLASESKE